MTESQGRPPGSGREHVQSEGEAQRQPQSSVLPGVSLVRVCTSRFSHIASIRGFLIWVSVFESAFI